MEPSSPTPRGESTDLAALDRAHDAASEAILAGDWSTAAAQLAALPLVPPLDPDEARHGRLELCALAAALGLTRCPVEKAPSGPTRLGFVLTGEQGDSEARAWPAFALALARGEERLTERFPDLWRVDHAVWAAIQRRETRAEIARRWLKSPGRRLLLDLRTLEPGRPTGGAAMALSALLEAAGSEGPATPDGWRSLHAAIPGADQAEWHPVPTDSVSAALRELDADDPLAREAAVGWLLRRAVTTRAYQVDHVAGDLRAELPIRLAAAFESLPSDAFDIATLRMASTLVCESLAPVADAWRLARWLRGLLRISPFSGGDPAVLAARVNALARAEMFAGPADVLDPRSITALGVAAFLAAVARHYAAPTPLWPTPGPITHRLRELARRPLEEPGRDDALGWQKITRAFDPTTAARRLCTDLKVDWIDRLEWVEEALGDPSAWIAEAIYRERATLPTGAAERIAARWSPDLDPARAAVLLAVSAGAALSDEARAALVTRALSAEAEWQPWLLGAICDTFAEQRDAGLAALVELVAGDAPERTRVDAALVAAQRIGDDDPLKPRLRALVQAPLFRHSGARGVLRKHGLLVG